MSLSHAVYRDMSEAMRRHPDAHVMVSFASLRSAYESTLNALSHPQVFDADIAVQLSIARGFVTFFIIHSSHFFAKRFMS